MGPHRHLSPFSVTGWASRVSFAPGRWATVIIALALIAGLNVAGAAPAVATHDPSVGGQGIPPQVATPQNQSNPSLAFILVPQAIADTGVVTFQDDIDSLVSGASVDLAQSLCLAFSTTGDLASRISACGPDLNVTNFDVNFGHRNLTMGALFAGIRNLPKTRAEVLNGCLTDSNLPCKINDRLDWVALRNYVRIHSPGALELFEGDITADSILAVLLLHGQFSQSTLDLTQQGPGETVQFQSLAQVVDVGPITIGGADAVFRAGKPVDRTVLETVLGISVEQQNDFDLTAALQGPRQDATAIITDLVTGMIEDALVRPVVPGGVTAQQSAEQTFVFLQALCGNCLPDILLPLGLIINDPLNNFELCCEAGGVLPLLGVPVPTWFASIVTKAAAIRDGFLAVGAQVPSNLLDLALGGVTIAGVELGFATTCHYKDFAGSWILGFPDGDSCDTATGVSSPGICDTHDSSGCESHFHETCFGIPADGKCWVIPPLTIPGLCAFDPANIPCKAGQLIFKVVEPALAATLPSLIETATGGGLSQFTDFLGLGGVALPGFPNISCPNECSVPGAYVYVASPIENPVGTITLDAAGPSGFVAFADLLEANAVTLTASGSILNSRLGLGEILAPGLSEGAADDPAAARVVARTVTINSASGSIGKATGPITLTPPAGAAGNLKLVAEATGGIDIKFDEPTTLDFDSAVAGSNARFTVQASLDMLRLIAETTGTLLKVQGSNGNNTILAHAYPAVSLSVAGGLGDDTLAFDTEGRPHTQTAARAINVDGRSSVTHSGVEHITGIDPTISRVRSTLPGEQTTLAEGGIFGGAVDFIDWGADAWTVTVDWGDGSPASVLARTRQAAEANTAALSQAFSHVYADNGNYTVTVTVDDNQDSSSATATIDLTVTNVPPTIEAGANRTVQEGRVIGLAPSSFHDAGTLDTHTATVNWGDGTATEVAAVAEAPFGPPGSTAGLAGTIAAQHVYADNGTYEVTVCVLDDDQQQASAVCDTLDVTVTNAPPTIDVGLDRTTTEGAVVTLGSAGFHDAGTLDTHTATVNWGDGTATEVAAVGEDPFGPPGSTDGLDGTIAAQHVYADNGTYEVTVCVLDDDQSQASAVCDDFDLTVFNINPTTQITRIGDGPPVFLPRVEVEVEATFNDLGTLDTHVASMAWRDGTTDDTGGGGVTLVEAPFGPPGATSGADGTIFTAHTYSATGAFDTVLTVVDDDAGSGAVATTITVVSPAAACRVASDLLGALSTSDPAAAAALVEAAKLLDGTTGKGRSPNPGACDKLDDHDLSAALRKIEFILEELAAARQADPGLEVGTTQILLIQVAESVASDLLDRAMAVLDPASRGDARKIALLQDEFASGQTWRQTGDHVASANHFWELAKRAEPLVDDLPNLPPIAVDDAATTDEDTPVEIDVTANDTDPDGNLKPRTVVVTVPAGAGNASVDATTGSVTYLPDPDVFGTDTFQYRVCDTGGLCDVATVVLTVAPVDDGPRAVEDAASTVEDTPAEVLVLGNDFDPEGDPFDLVAGLIPTEHGGAASCTAGATGSCTYEPPDDFNGTDRFAYDISDGARVSTGLVVVTVTPVNDLPTAGPDVGVTPEDTALDVDVLANDSDVDGDTLFVRNASAPAHGSITANGIGGFLYTPDADFHGSDGFTYDLCDRPGTSSCVAGVAVSITVSPIDDPPTAVADSVSTAEDEPVTFAPLGNDSAGPADENQSLTFGVVGDAANGTVDENVDETLTYTPDPDFSGSDSLQYEACDAAGSCAQADVTITVTPTNDPPVAEPDFFGTDEDTPVPGLAVTDNDTDVESAVVTIAAFDAVSALGGSVSCGPSTCDYAPAADVHGIDSFGYTIDDGTGGQAAGTVTITVAPINDAPVADDEADTTAEDTTLVGATVLEGDVDVDADPLTVTLSPVDGTDHGTLTLAGDGTFTYYPFAHFYGTDSFVYEVCDPSAACDTAKVTITVTPVNDPPTAGDDAVDTNEDTPVTVDVLDGSDEDVDGDLLIVDDVVVQPDHGLAVVTGDGEVTYTPDPNYHGLDSFTYSACDPDDACDTAVVTVTVIPVNDQPVAVANDYTIAEDTDLRGINATLGTEHCPFESAGPGDDPCAGAQAGAGLLDNDSDIDGDVLASFLGNVLVAHGTLYLYEDGGFLYRPAPEFNGVETFEYNACDAEACQAAIVTVTVTAVDDPPTAVDDDVEVTKNIAIVIDASANDSAGPADEDQALTITEFTDPASGVVTGPDAGGNLTYTPATDYEGEDSFTYTVCDSGGTCASALVTLTIA